MSERPSPEQDPAPGPGELEAARRLAEIFGDVLPESTSDDRDPQTADRGDDSWYTENRPPHHDAR